MTGRCALAGLALAGACLAAMPAGAAPAPPPSALAAWNHTQWSAQDGAPAQVTSMAQTRDGWLWLGTADGLYRFDGVAFERVTLPQRGMLGRSLVFVLHARANGDLLIGHLIEGLSVLHADGSFTDIPDRAGAPIGGIGAIDVDSAGTIWVISVTGVHTFAHGAWRTVTDGARWQPGAVRNLLRDQDGVLWASFDNQTWRFEAAGGRFVPAGSAGAHGSLLQSPDGRVWATRGGRVVPISPAAQDGRRRRDARSNDTESRADGQFDRAGNLWKIQCPVGACLLPAGAASGGELDPIGRGEQLAPGRQIGGSNPEQVLEDREGNIWISTENGLDRYQPKVLHPSGLGGSGTPISLAVDADGAVWAADATDSSLWRLQAGSAPVRQPGRVVRVAGTARDGALLLSGKRDIERRFHGSVTRIPLPPVGGKAIDLTVVGTLDDGKVLWMASYETGLMGYVDGAWRPRSAFKLPPKIVISAAGAPGQLWLADGDGALILYDGGTLTRYDAAMAGIATAVFAGADVMVAGERGLAVLQHGAMRLLHAHRPDAKRQDVMRNISGMAVTPDGDRWFNGAAGIVHVRARDWRRALDHPGELLQYQLFDARDGYPGQAANINRLPSVVQTPGGQLWFAATGGVVRLETRALQRNPVAPTVQVQQVSTAQASYRAETNGTTPVRLPPASASFTVAWTAPALRRPENLQYMYRLEGVDAAWRDAASGRSASYTNVGPGQYRFHVRVANEDGVPGAAAAVQTIVVPPTMVQSAWFKALCALALVLVGVALYRYRIRVLTARVVERMQVRTSERERIARTLHDTYLQSVNALMLRVGAMAQSLPPDNPTRATLETVLADATDAVVEGRGQVEQLRAPPAAPVETLDSVLARSAAPLRQAAPGIAFDIQVSGTLRPLAPRVLDEAAQIGAEALRNAFLHAGARTIGVRIAYGNPFTLAIQDDGKGLDDDVLRQGYRSGHWGLLGMRERARTIGARLEIDSAAGTGTTIRLAVPGAYAPTRARWFGAWLDRRRGR